MRGAVIAALALACAAGLAYAANRADTPASSATTRHVERASKAAPARPPSDKDTRRVVETFETIANAVDERAQDCDALAADWKQAIANGGGAIGRFNASRNAARRSAQLERTLARARTAVATAMTTCKDSDAFEQALRDLTQLR